MHPTLVVAAEYAWRLVVVAGAAAIGLWLVGQLRLVLLAVVVALLLTRILSPFTGWLRVRGVPAAAAAGLGLVLFLAGVGAIVGMVGWGVAGELSDLPPTVDDGWRDVEDWLVEEAPIDLSRERVQEWRQQAGEGVRSSLLDPQGGAAGAASYLVDVPTGVILSLFVTFFLLKDGDRFVGLVARSLAEERAETAARMAREAWATLGGFLRGAAVLGAVEGVTIGVTVALVGGRLALPIALLTFAAAFVPLVGAVVAGVIAVLVTLVTAGLTEALIVGIVALVVQQLDGDVLAPVVYGRMLRLHPVVIVVAVVAGGSLFGLVGAMLAVPLVAVVVNCLAAARTDRGDSRVA